jgi:hypothetical protein
VISFGLAIPLANTIENEQDLRQAGQAPRELLQHTDAGAAIVGIHVSLAGLLIEEMKRTEFENTCARHRCIRRNWRHCAVHA